MRDLTPPEGAAPSTYRSVCHRCGIEIASDEEDDFAERAREHARGHGHHRPLTRASILRRGRRGR